MLVRGCVGLLIFTMLAKNQTLRISFAWHNQYGCVVHALDHCMDPSPSHHYASHYACMVNPGYTSRTFFHSVSNFLGFKLFYFLYTTIAVRFTILVVMSAMVARSAIVVRSVFPAKCNNLLSIDCLIKTGKWLLKLSGKFSPPNHVCYLGKPSSAVSSLRCGVVYVCVCVWYPLWDMTFDGR